MIAKLLQAVWKIIYELFGLSYLTLLLFCLMQNYDTIKQMIYWYDPELKYFKIDFDRDYTLNCNLTIELFWDYMDDFAVYHFLGWAIKAMMVRHLVVVWIASAMWEVLELEFTHFLKTFAECWWDIILLDLLLCNGTGIWLGLKVNKFLEIPDYNWFSIRDSDSTKLTGQQTRWFDPSSVSMRFLIISLGITFWLVGEFNVFLLKHIFEVTPSHSLVLWRTLIIGIVVTPAISEFYVYVTDPNCKRLGIQCWKYLTILIVEFLICIKNDRNLFIHVQAKNIFMWLFWIFVATYFSVYLSVYGPINYAKYCCYYARELFRCQLTVSRRKPRSQTFKV